MQVNELIRMLHGAMPLSVEGAQEEAASPVAGLAYHSGRVVAGGLFAAVPGTRDDGTRHVAEALARGARMILYPLRARHGLGACPPGTVFIGVEDVRRALALAADLYYGRPSRSMTMIGVTGTNGKTTLTYLVESMTRQADLPCGVIGTIEYRLQGRAVTADRTTPEAPDLQETLRWMADGGARVVVMEISSHALVQRRVDGTRFDFGVFNNLSQDHLDFHGDMESYYQAKRRFFTDFGLQASVINLDDPWGRRLAGEAGGEIITYGSQPECHVRPREVSLGEHGIRMILEVPAGILHLTTPLLGAHNAQNITAAAALGWRMGLPAAAIEQGIAAMREVPGRFQRVSLPGEPLVVVDYAHTPDALEKLLTGARPITAGRLILVFGCGGDRDRAKRPLMGQAAARGADLSIITSDNPRSEDPQAIIASVEEGYRSVRQDACRVIADRREAIFQAIREAVPGDTVAIAGKGHEDYQILGSHKIHFDDRETAREALNSRAGETVP
jgi:UDP-N-acetylmuramoyl-L-alanyl-D-glutamate--2,6-diaminopimelate ligase